MKPINGVRTPLDTGPSLRFRRMTSTCSRSLYAPSYSRMGASEVDNPIDPVHRRRCRCSLLSIYGHLPKLDIVSYIRPGQARIPELWWIIE